MIFAFSSVLITPNYFFINLEEWIKEIFGYILKNVNIDLIIDMKIYICYY